MPHRQINVDLDELVAAMDSRFDGMTEWFLDTQTGEIHPIDAGLIIAAEDEDDEDDDLGEGEIDAPVPEWQREERALAEQICADPERFVGIPETESHEAYRVMEDFIATVPDARLRERLEDAIAGKGAFRRFKDVLLAHPRVREEWFRFEANVKRQWAAEWLESIGLQSTWQPRAAADGNA